MNDGTVVYLAMVGGLALGVLGEWLLAKWRDRR